MYFWWMYERKFPIIWIKVFDDIPQLCVYIFDCFQHTHLHWLQVTISSYKFRISLKVTNPQGWKLTFMDGKNVYNLVWCIIKTNMYPSVLRVIYYSTNAMDLFKSIYIRPRLDILVIREILLIHTQKYHVVPRSKLSVLQRLAWSYQMTLLWAIMHFDWYLTNKFEGKQYIPICMRSFNQKESSFLLCLPMW